MTRRQQADRPGPGPGELQMVMAISPCARPSSRWRMASATSGSGYVLPTMGVKRPASSAPPRAMVVGLLPAAKRGMALVITGEGQAHSSAGSRAPRTLVITIPMVNTSVAQIAAPRSCGGRAARSRVWSVLEGATGSAARRRRPPGRPRGPAQARRPPSAAAHSRPMPAIPARLRSTSRVPPARCAPVPAAVSAPAAAAVARARWPAAGMAATGR